LIKDSHALNGPYILTLHDFTETQTRPIFIFELTLQGFRTKFNSEEPSSNINLNFFEIKGRRNLGNIFIASFAKSYTATQHNIGIFEYDLEKEFNIGTRILN